MENTHTLIYKAETRFKKYELNKSFETAQKLDEQILHDLIEKLEKGGSRAKINNEVDTNVINEILHRKSDFLEQKNKGIIGHFLIEEKNSLPIRFKEKIQTKRWKVSSDRKVLQNTDYYLLNEEPKRYSEVLEQKISTDKERRKTEFQGLFDTSEIERKMIKIDKTMKDKCLDFKPIIPTKTWGIYEMCLQIQTLLALIKAHRERIKTNAAIYSKNLNILNRDRKANEIFREEMLKQFQGMNNIIEEQKKTIDNQKTKIEENENKIKILLKRINSLEDEKRRSITFKNKKSKHKVKVIIADYNKKRKNI